MNSVLTEICSDGKLTFTEILKLVFQGIREVISAIDVDIYSTGTIGVSFWELVLGMLTVSIIFGFFLKSRGGSVFGALGNLNEYENSKRAEAERQAQKEFNNSFEGYAQRRSRNEVYNYEYNRIMGENALKSHKGGQ